MQIIEPATETLIERTDAPCARFSLLERMFVERGDLRSLIR